MVVMIMKKKVKYLALFGIFLLLLSLSPIAGDDWGNYLVGKLGIKNAFQSAWTLYFNWEGRLVSRILINILTYHKYLWNIVNAILLVVFVYGVEKLIGQNKKYIFALVGLLLFGMNPYMFSQVIVWLAGNMTYFFIVPVLIIYFYFLIRYDHYNKWFKILFCFINFLGTMFVENMALVFVIGNILVCIYKYIKSNKIDKWILLYLVFAISGTAFMLLSPGTKYRSSIENIEFNQLSFFEKILRNIPNFIYYTFTSNTFLLFLMGCSNCLLVWKHIRNKWLKFVSVFYILVGSILTIVIYPLSLAEMNRFDFLINTNNIFVIGYWLIYFIIMSVLLYVEDRQDGRVILLFLIGLVGNVVMLLSPTWGYRTAFFTYMMFGICSIIILARYLEENKWNIIVSEALLGVICVIYVIFYINIYICQKELEKNIVNQVESHAEVIYIDAFPAFANCNINPENEYHLAKFKQYYGIDANVKISLVRDKWKYVIFYIK